MMEDASNASAKPLATARNLPADRFDPLTRDIMSD